MPALESHYDKADTRLYVVAVTNQRTPDQRTPDSSIELKLHSIKVLKLSLVKLKSLLTELGWRA
jgi:hypothetical protein